MLWLQNHIVEILAVVGFLYAAARGIVALTPTPKDDEALSKVALWLKTIAKAFGLDLTQGVEKKETFAEKVANKTMGGDYKSPLIILMLCSLFLSGCAQEIQQNPKAELLIAQKTFVSVVNSLTILQQAGKFDKNETKEITKIIHTGYEFLVRWESALLTGQDVFWMNDKFRDIAIQLIEYQLGKESDNES